MGDIRVILAIEPKILADSLRATIADEPDVQLVVDTRDGLDLLLATKEHEPHVVIMTVSPHGRLPPIGTHLLAEFPFLLIVGVTPRGERLYVYRNAVRTEHHAVSDLREFIAQLRTTVADYSP